MTILTRRCQWLDWKFPFNTRELKPGETAQIGVVWGMDKGVETWRVTAKNEDEAYLSYVVLPTDSRESIYPQVFNPQAGLLKQRDEINNFGVKGLRNWRWVQGKERG